MAGMDVNARLTLDSAQFDANMKKSGEVATATGRAAAKAAKDSAAAQAIAAKFAGDAVSAQSIRILQAQKAQSAASAELRQVQSLVNRGALDGAAAANTEAAALQRVIAAKLATASASHLQAQAEKAASDEATHALTKMQATSGAIRGLEGQSNLRAFERFASMIPGVGAAAMAIFPAVGLAAAVMAFAKIGSEIYDVEQKAKHASESIKKDFGEFNEELKISNLELTVTADKLEDDIAKLGKHPSNGLTTGLDEMTLAAEKLAKSLDKDIDKVTELAEKNRVGFWGGLMSNTGQTKDVASLANSVKKDVDAVRHSYDATVSQAIASGDKDNIAQAQQARLVALQKAYAKGDAKLKAAQDAAQQAQDFRESPSSSFGSAMKTKGSGVGFDSSVDNNANINLAAATRETLLQEQNEIGTEYRKGNDQQKKAVLEGAKSLGEVDSKAAEARYKAMEAHVAEWKTLAPVTSGAIYEYWDAQRNAFAVGSAQYNSIVEKQATLATEMATKAHESILKHKEWNKRLAEEAAKLPQDPMEREDRDKRRAMAEMVDASNEANAQSARNAARLAEVAIQEASGHTLTRIAAATELAAVHTREYGAELDRLIAKQKAVQDNKDFDDGLDMFGKKKLNAEGQKEFDQLNKQIEAQKAGRTVQIMQDQYNINGPDSSAAVGGKEALEEFTKAALDSASQMKNMVNGAIRDINKTLLEELTTKAHGPRHLWTNVGKDLAKNATGSLLEHGEGMLLKGLGVGGGKLGTSGNPMWVRMAAGTVSSAASSVSSAAGGLGSFIGKFLHIPGFANGGEPQQNSMAWVGENGPELVRFGSQRASVIPNHALPMGGAGDMHFHVDARGATDPAAVMSMVHQGLRQAAPQIMAATIQAQRSGNARIPSSQRR